MNNIIIVLGKLLMGTINLTFNLLNLAFIATRNYPMAPPALVGPVL